LRELTQYAAVLGERFTAPVLKSLSKNKNIDFDVAMDKIVKSGLVVEHSNETSLEYSFAHTLIHDVIYQSLPGRIQKRLHGEVLQCLEDLTGEDTVGHAHLLGHHAFACQDWQKALKYNQAAGNEALSRSASDDAIRYLDNALVAVKNLTKDEDLSRTELDLLFGLRTAYLPLGMLDKIKDCLIEAEKLCASLNDRGLMGKINAHKTGYLYLAGQQRKAINAGIRALKVAVERKDSEFESDISFRLGQCYYATGAYKSAVGHLSRSIEYLSGEHVFDRLGTPGLPSVTARAWLAASLAELGESDRAISQAHEGLDLAKQANQPYGLIHAVWGLYQAYSRCGDFSKAVPHLEEALKIFDNWHIPLWYPPIISCLGVSYLHTGHTTKALQLLTEAVERAGELKSDVHKATLVAHLGRGQRATGQLVEAGKSLSTAIKIARKNGERGEEAWALWCRGYQQMDIGKAKFADAEADYKASLMISEQLEMQPLSTNCKSALSELYSRMDRD
jgi:tetratricopeptide (TPR) repeat protein